MHHPTDRIAHITAFVTSVVEPWLEREIAQLIFINYYFGIEIRETKMHSLKRTDLRSIANQLIAIGRKQGNILFNDALNTFCLRLYSVGHMVRDHSVRAETRCMSYSFRLAARALFYPLSYKQDITYHGLSYTSLAALAGTRNSSTIIRDLSDNP